MENVWAALRALSYREMIALSTELRDVAQGQGMDVHNGYDWAMVLSEAAEQHNPEVDA